MDWLIQYKGLPEVTRENVISNLKRDYERVELQGALKQAMKQPAMTLNFSLFGWSKKWLQKWRNHEIENGVGK